MLDNSKRVVDENSVLVTQVRDELERLMELQVNNIERGFQELVRKLTEKKQEILMGFERKFKKEEQRLMNKQDLIGTNADELRTIEQIFEELVQFIEVSNDPQILQKIQDISTFLHKSFVDLDLITKNQIGQKREIFIDETFKPLSFNVTKALEIVKKFEMVWPDRYGNDQPPQSDNKSLTDPLNAPVLTAGERIGLYKSSS